MQRFKRGDAVWVFWQDRFGYPQMHYRPGVVTKKVHPTSYLVAFVANDPRRCSSEWKLDRQAKQRHPSDMIEYDPHLGAVHLRHLRKEWAQTVDQATYEAWKASEAERKQMSEELNRKLRPIFARMLGAAS